MNEPLFIVFVNIFAVALSSCLYALGGAAGFSKLFRRIGASAVIGIALNVTALTVHRWQWQYIVMPFILAGCFSEGYGEESIPEKIKRRSVIAICYIGCYAFGLWACSFTSSAWLVFAMSSLLVAFSIPIGVVNPWSSARLEEAFIDVFATLMLISWPFVR